MTTLATLTNRLMDGLARDAADARSVIYDHCHGLCGLEDAASDRFDAWIAEIHTMAENCETPEAFAELARERADLRLMADRGRQREETRRFDADKYHLNLDRGLYPDFVAREGTRETVALCGPYRIAVELRDGTTAYALYVDDDFSNRVAVAYFSPRSSRVPRPRYRDNGEERFLDADTAAWAMKVAEYIDDLHQKNVARKTESV